MLSLDTNLYCVRGLNIEAFNTLHISKVFFRYLKFFVNYKVLIYMNLQGIYFNAGW